MKVALVVPPGYSVPHAQFNLERIGLGYLAAPLRAAGATVRLLDGIIDRLSWDALEAEVTSFAPDLLGVSLMSHHGGPELQQFLTRMRARSPHVHISLGGTFPSLNWRPLLRAFPEVDSVVCGEGESAVMRLVAALGSGASLDRVPGLATRRGGEEAVLSPPESVLNLDHLAWPARDQIETVLSRGGPATLISSRGCYARCTFCAIEAVTRSLYPRPMRYRSAADVVDEVADIHRRFGAQRLYFVDENFMGPGIRGRERAKAIAREIQARDLRIAFSIECRCMDVDEETFRELAQAGLQRVFLGVESTDQDELERFRKAQDYPMITRAISVLRALGIHVEIGFILFTPWSSLESLRRKRVFLEAFGAHATASLGSYLSIMPGTAIENSLRDAGLLGGSWPDYWFEFQDRAAAILFGLVQRELVSPWTDVVQALLSYHWNRPLDWSIEHALRRAPDEKLEFVRELLAWVARVRMQVFDALLSVVARLDLPQDASAPPRWALDELRATSEMSRRSAAEAEALLQALTEGESEQLPAAAEPGRRDGPNPATYVEAAP